MRGGLSVCLHVYLGSLVDIVVAWAWSLWGRGGVCCIARWFTEMANGYYITHRVDGIWITAHGYLQTNQETRQGKIERSLVFLFVVSARYCIHA